MKGAIFLKIAKDNHYLVNTDQEVLLHLFKKLEEYGVITLSNLIQKMQKLDITSFNELLTYASGPDCDSELAIVIEEVIERLRLANVNRDAIFTSSKEVGTYLADKLAGRKQEEFWALYLDNSNRIIAEKKLFQGTLDRSVAHPREIFRWAVIYGCSGIFVVHNHPSGKLLPSNSDFKLTRELKQASDLMKIDFLDHFIVGKGHYLSMKENELF
ncbi:JAB domain-containing protein [Lactobacillus sp. PSON]|uniref:JAB domain-containing protein n=1 Tax=Lactobacillus sp. PSON TaxID=3455454 RepID=UPI004041A07C